MKRYLLLAPLALCLANNGSCGLNSASAAHDCSVALAGAATAQDILNVLIAHGAAPSQAAKIQQALTIAQITATAACASISPLPPAP